MEDPISKYIVLVPLAYNDGTPVSEEVILEFKERLFLLADGWTVAGAVEGAYRMADGKQQIDHSLQFWIWIHESRVKNSGQLWLNSDTSWVKSRCTWNRLAAHSTLSLLSQVNLLPLRRTTDDAKLSTFESRPGRRHVLGQLG